MLSSLILAAALQFAAETPATQDVIIDRAALATPAGAAAAYDQLHEAARSVCLADNAPGIWSEYRVRVCTADTMDRAIADLGAPQLVQLHAERTDTRQPVIPRLYAARD